MTAKPSVIDFLAAQSDPPAKPRKHPNTKRTGELAEAAFVVKAAGLGFAVSKPWGDSERYDFILDAGHRIWRVQVKCTESLNANGYQVQSTYTDHKKKGHYTAADIDVLVAYILPLDLWYVVPAHAFPASASLRFYPDGNPSGRRPRFEQYREAWHLFREPGVPRLAVSETWDAGNPQDNRRPTNNCHPERSGAPGAPGVGAAGSGSEGPASPTADRDTQSTCHPERSDSLAKRGSHEVEGPGVSSSEKTADPSPVPAAPPAPQSPMERMMSQWAQRVNALYNRKP